MLKITALASYGSTADTDFNARANSDGFAGNDDGVGGVDGVDGLMPVDCNGDYETSNPAPHSTD
jgi:hypothetical protein